MGFHVYFKSLNKLERLERCPGEFMFERHNVAAHSFKVTKFAQFLGEVEAKNGEIIDWKLLYEKAINHDYTEVFIGDIKTPVKYSSPELREKLAEVEKQMAEAFVSQEIPADFQEIYRNKFKEAKDHTKEGLILAAADKLDILYESFEELQRGNTEEVFITIYKESLAALKSIPLYSVSYFMNEVLPEMIAEELNSTIDIKHITEEILTK